MAEPTTEFYDYGITESPKAPHARPAVAPKHCVRYDEPSATSRRLQKAACGSWVRPLDVSDSRDGVNCPRCQQWLAAYEAMEI